MLSYFYIHVEYILGILLILACPCLLGMFFAAQEQKSVRHKRLWQILWMLPLVAVITWCVVGLPIGTILNDVPLFIPLYLSFGVAGRSFRLKSVKHWLAIGCLVLGTVLFSTLDYGGITLFFLPVMNGVVLAYYFRIVKTKPLKILWLILWGMLLSTILFRHVLFDFFNFSYEYLLEVGGPFLLFSLLVYFLKLGKKFCLIFCPVFMVVSFLVCMLQNGSFSSYAQPFGTIVDSKLVPETYAKNPDVDYELVIRSADAWNNHSEITFIQSRGDSCYICRMADPCYLDEKDKGSCQWELIDSASASKVLSLIQSIKEYQQEEISYTILDGEIFEINYYDFKNGTRRYLEIGNAGFDVPKAQALVLKSIEWLLPQDTSAAYEAEVQKCFENMDAGASE